MSFYSTRDDSGGKDNILGSDSIIVRENASKGHLSNFRMVTDINTVNGNKVREITKCLLSFHLNLVIKRQLCYAEMINWLQITTNVVKSHRQPQCTLQLVSEDRVLFD